MVYRKTSVASQNYIGAWLHICMCFCTLFSRVFAIVLSKFKISGISVVRVTIAKIRESMDVIGPSGRQFNSTTKNCSLAYLRGRISLTALVFHQMAHQVPAIGRSTFENVIPRLGRVFVKLDLAPVRQFAGFLSKHTG